MLVDEKEKGKYNAEMLPPVTSKTWFKLAANSGAKLWDSYKKVKMAHSFYGERTHVTRDTERIPKTINGLINLRVTD